MYSKEGITKNGKEGYKMATTLADVKKLNWAKCFATRNDFDGAILEVKTEDEEDVVSLVFGDAVVYLVEDADGIYSTADIEKHIIKDKGIPHLNARFEGAVVVAVFDPLADVCAVSINEESLEKYDINTLDVREEIRTRLELFFDVSQYNASKRPSM